MCQAGFLQGLPDSADLSQFWQMSVIDDDARREKFHAKYPGKLTIKFRHVPHDFGKMLIKIGYGHTLSQLETSDFRQFCLPYMFGTKTNVSFVVGGNTQLPQPMPNLGYSIGTACFGSASYLIITAIIRLMASTNAPEYHVVVGDVSGAQAVANVMGKLGADAIIVGNHSAEHWVAPNFLGLKIPS